MRKNILSALVLLVFGYTNAQSRDQGDLEIIPQVGVISANYYGGESGPGNEPITSASFGLTGNYFFNDRWSLFSGLVYQPMGTELQGYKDELNYLTIPVNASWHFGSTRKWNLNFGPSIGFITSAKTTNLGDIKDMVNPIQIGLNVGIGYKIQISENFSLLIDYQSQTGLTDALKDFSVKNGAGTFNLGGVIKL